MKVVALVSGGKDSCYAMQRCIDYGHEIVALANLLPADDEVDELDSFMFQTVGHQMICAIAQCMGLPLFRRRIQGTSRLQELRYKKTLGDEVEDLEKLLVAVKQKYPDLGGVSSGAIASNYQRLRVESICSRLGLVSLAYLWEQDQAALLQDMIDSGIHAVLVKVAAIGMDPQKHLGKDLASLQPHLTRLASLYGSNVCGEGGEYESLTLDSPLFKHARIVLDDFEIALHSPDQIAPVGVLQPTKFHLEPKDASSAKPISPPLVFEVTDTVATNETVMCGEELAALESANIENVQLTVMSPQHGTVSMGCWRQECAKLGVREELGLPLSTVEKSFQQGEGELEDGELSGGVWESGEDDEADHADSVRLEEVEAQEQEDVAYEEEEEEIVDYRTEGLTPVVMQFGVDARMNEAPGNPLGKDHKKNSKRRKGKGALSRQRKRSRLEKMQKGSNEPSSEANVDGRQHGNHLALGLKRKVESAGEKQQKTGNEGVDIDAGPEEGEVFEEDNRGLLSQLVEEEVGLWTTDVGDEQITSSKIDSDEDGKKKTRAPISAERKLKKKVTFRRKRAEKEKELGIRRPRIPVTTFKPKIPLCKFYIKGRCTLGAKCTFSHDVVPVTKSDPCKFFMVNRCLKGDDCPFSHSLDTFPCKFWHTRGHCLDGNNCRFSHGPLTDDQRQNLAKRIEHDAKEQQNVPDITTDFNKPENSESEYMPTLDSSRAEALNPSQLMNQDTPNYESTSLTFHRAQACREILSAAPRSPVPQNQTAEINREEIVLTETCKEEMPVENAVLLAARKAASAAAVQAAAAGTTDKLISRTSPSISLLKTRTFGRPAGRGSEASSAMDLLQATTQPRCVNSPITYPPQGILTSNTSNTSRFPPDRIEFFTDSH